MRMPWSLPFAIACSCVVRADAQRGTPERPSGVIDGLVTDSALTPLSDASVAILQTNLRVQTGESGRFRIIRIPPARYLITVRRLGFAPVASVIAVTADDTLRLSLMLQPAIPVLAAAVSRANESTPRLEGFEERRRHEVGGRYITRAEIDAQSPTQTSDLMRRIMGLHVEDSLGVLVPVSSRGMKIIRDPVSGGLATAQCVMRIAVNGFLKEPDFAMNSIPPTDIHGIEIYSGPADVPPEYAGANSDSFCGLIIIWTRSG
jgi:carboxypeptidase family protein/TonB-dependent receptor-like protein